MPFGYNYGAEAVRNTDQDRNHKIANAYQSAEFTTEYIAQKFGITPRRVQQIAKDFGIVRTRAEGNRVATPLKRSRRIRL